MDQVQVRRTVRQRDRVQARHAPARRTDLKPHFARFDFYDYDLHVRADFQDLLRVAGEYNHRLTLPNGTTPVTE